MTSPCEAFRYRLLSYFNVLVKVGFIRPAQSLDGIRAMNTIPWSLACWPVNRYLREPLQLPYGETVFLKWGSNVVSLKAKRSIRHRISNLVGRRATVRLVSLIRLCFIMWFFLSTTAYKRTLREDTRTTVFWGGINCLQTWFVRFSLETVRRKVYIYEFMQHVAFVTWVLRTSVND